MKTIKRVKLCLIAVLAVVFVWMSCALVATNVKRVAAVSLDSGTFVMDNTGLTLRTNNQVGPRFKVKMDTDLAERIKTENITLGFLIAPRAAFDKVNYNYETLFAAAKAAATETSAPARIQVAEKAKIYEEGGYSWASLVINTGEANRTLDMSVVAYITYYSDSIGANVNRFAATDVEKVRGNLYNVVNTTALSDAELAKDILGNNQFGWYGAGNYPIEISTTEQAEVLKNSEADLSGKVVLADSSVDIPSEISGNVKTVTEETVDGKAEIVLGSGTSYPVDMGISDGNVVKATIGGKVVSYADGNVTLDFDFENRLIKHGEQTLTVTVEKEGQYTNYNKEVLIVTQEIETFEELKSALAFNANNVKFGYYRLKNSLTPNDYWYESGNNITKNSIWKNPTGELGFRGTLDGNNNSIKATFYSTGLFGFVGKGAVIKNITFNMNQYNSGKMLFGYSMIGATVDNVNVNVTQSSGGITEIPPENVGVSGLLTAIFSYGNTFNNLVVDAQNTDVDTLFGNCAYYSYPAGYEANKFTACTVKAKSLIGIACTNNANQTVIGPTGIDGLDVTLGA